MTPREKEIADLICDGYTNKEIANKLNISYFTVKSHVSKIYMKMRVKGRIHLMNKLKKGD